LIARESCADEDWPAVVLEIFRFIALIPDEEAKIEPSRNDVLVEVESFVAFRRVPTPTS
jgi:hypothetical protein